MLILLQRVTRATVEVDGQIVGGIDRGYLLLVGVAHDDTHAVADRMAEKIVNLRLFNNDAGKFDQSLLDAHGS